MNDSREELQSILSRVCPNVYEKKAEKIIGPYPMITYYDSDHIADDYSDGINKSDIIEYTIECFEQEPNITDVYFKMDNLLRSNGYFRTWYTKVFQEESKLRHVTIKYKKVGVEINE